MADETQKPGGSASDEASPLTMKELANFTEEVILPGVDRIVDEKLGPLHDDTKAGFDEMRMGFEDLKKSIAVLSGEIAELKVRDEEQRHEERIQRVEVKLGIRSAG